jgi:D-alanyl-D-alanine carboxypeptidase
MSAPTSIKTVPIRAAALPIPNLNAYAPAPEIGSAALESSPLRGPADARPLEDETSPAVTGNIGPQIADTGPRRTGWSVQVGAFDQEDEARQRLNMARSKATDLLAASEPYTERTSRGDKALYRARFGGLDRTQADSVCKILHRSDVACIAIKN